jgi:nickel/cobalt transporter (NiCoT) family protein
MFRKAILTSFRHNGTSTLRRRITLIYAFLVGLNLVAWIAAFAAFHAYPAALSLCFLAYGFGLRHAVDADHIAAIDNVTRKLMQDKQMPVGVGLFFSLGHSTVVILMSLLAAHATGYAKSHFPQFQEVGGIIGTSVSAFFLLLIALVNFVILVDVFRAFQAARRGDIRRDDALEGLIGGRGLVARVLGRLFRSVGKSWHMYFIGFLFGLGFDTATQVASLGIAVTEAAQQMPIWSIMVFPLLFTSGMCLLDTTDGIVMLGAYGWAFVRPVRKLFYNMTITSISFLIALLIGSLEGLSVIASRFHLDGGFWAVVNLLTENSTAVGYGIIILMIASWIVSILVYRVAGFDKLDEVPVVADRPREVFQR